MKQIKVSIKDEVCLVCKKPAKLEAKPARHLTSPNTAEFTLDFCSKDCRNEYNKQATKFYSELDRNASDSDCFIHDHWEKDSLNRNIRVGRCKITGKEVRVEPGQPGDNSGQPIECYEHWTPRL